MKFKEDNIFLDGVKGGLTPELRKYFKDTVEVKRIIDGFFVSLYGASNDNDTSIVPRDGKYIVAV